MNQSVQVDVVIFGGGIAGLWLLTRLRAKGYAAILLESDALGSGQTGKSQGIIHGGMKYALTGALNSEALAISDMPEIWRLCLEGKGLLNLSAVPVLSKQQYLWSPQRFTSKITGFLAGATLSSKVDSMSKDSYPSAFKHPDFKGEVFALNEMVIDVPVMVSELAKANQGAIFQIEPFNDEALQFAENGDLKSVTVCCKDKTVTLQAQQFVFTAGSGNEAILHLLQHDAIAMQRRPLHMVVVQVPFKDEIYAHCMGLGAKPRITITTHHTQNGKTIWYLGGNLAEEGVERSKEDQQKLARKELQDLFPWLDFTNAQFDSFYIDRAENKQKGLLKPDSSFHQAIHNMTVAWPTKLVLAPKLAEDIITQLTKQNIKPQANDTQALQAWPAPPVALPVWEELFCKSAN